MQSYLPNGGQILTTSIDFLKLTVYVAFFSVLLRFYGLPLHIMRDLFLSFRSFFKRVSDFVRYRNATRDMNARYPDATAEEVGREDLCIICREEMRPPPAAEDTNSPGSRSPAVTERMRPKRLPCGHILHFSCLRSWLERQQICPTCRRPVFAAQRGQLQVGRGPALQGNAVEQPEGAAPAENQRHQPGRNRARVINFGPLRIGFGAGGGNLVDDLARRIHNGDQAAPVEPDGNQGGQQHFGIGFGFGRRPAPQNQVPVPAPAPVASSTLPIHGQLDQIERSIQSQINSLRVASNELQLVRRLNQELLRLRNLQANRTDQAGATAQAEAAAMPMPLFSQAEIAAVGNRPQTTILSSHTQQPLSSDSDALPEGVTLPPGWTLLPLQRYHGPVQNMVSSDGTGVNTPETTAVPLAESGAHAPRPQSVSTNTPDPDAPLRSGVAGTERNGTHIASPEPGSDPPPAARFAHLPSWGSEPAQTNGENSIHHAKGEDPAGINGDRTARVNASADSQDNTTTEGTTQKGKAKAATVEEVLDDLD